MEREATQTLLTTPLSVDREAHEDWDDFWSVSGADIYRHHVAPRGHLYVAQRSSFPSPLKCIDEIRQTNSSEESSIDDCCHDDGNRTLSEDWIEVRSPHMGK